MDQREIYHLLSKSFISHVILSLCSLQSFNRHSFRISRQRTEALAHICPHLLSDVNSSDKYKFQKKFADKSIHDVIHNMSSPTIELQPASDEIPLDDIITEIWTEEGICYSFNALNSRDVYTEE